MIQIEEMYVSCLKICRSCERGGLQNTLFVFCKKNILKSV